MEIAKQLRGRPRRLAEACGNARSQARTAEAPSDEGLQARLRSSLVAQRPEASSS
jgi:hypothetical protein